MYDKRRKAGEGDIRSARGRSGVGLGLKRLMRIGVLPVKYNEEGRPTEEEVRGLGF